MQIRVINNSANILPEYATSGAAGMDLRADLSESIILKPGERKLIPTGLNIELPGGCEGQVRPRSGLALKHGITVLNAPGTLDSDYRGDIGVILINLGDKDFQIEPGDRIAQLVINVVETVELVDVDELTETGRGISGFGHTGVSDPSIEVINETINTLLENK